MERLPELKKIKASSLSPELYGEISEFFSSVHPDFAMSGKTSLFVLYGRLQKAKRKKISAKQLKKAEEMIRALCAALDARELEHRKREGPAREAKRGFKGKKGEGQLELRILLSDEIREKFRGIGISDEKAMERVLAQLKTESELGRRVALVKRNMPERAYRPLFGKIPDLLTAPDFPFAVAVISEKVKVIDGLGAAGRAAGLDYASDPSVLLFAFHEIAKKANLGGKMERIVTGGKLPRMDAAEVERISESLGLGEPESLVDFLKRAGYRIMPLAGRAYCCVKADAEGGIESVIYIDFGRAKRCHPVALSELFVQAAVAEKARAEAGAGK